MKIEKKIEKLAALALSFGGGMSTRSAVIAIRENTAATAVAYIIMALFALIYAAWILSTESS